MNFGTWLNKSCAMRTNPRQRAPLTRCNAIDLQRSGHLPDDRENQNRKHAHRPSCGQSGSFQNLVLEGYAFGTVFLKPFFRGVRGGEYLDVLGVANLQTYSLSKIVRNAL